jgi:hypothetical protein
MYIAKRENLPSCFVIVHYVNTLVGHVEKRANCITNGIKQNYDASVKLMLINHSKKTNNCSVARRFRLLEANIQSWRQQKEMLINVKSAQISYSGPKRDRFQGL